MSSLLAQLQAALRCLDLSTRLRNGWYRRLRRWGARGRGVRFGRGLVFRGDTRRILLGDGCQIDDHARLYVVGDEASITLGAESGVGPYNIINVHHRFVLGERSMLSPFVSIIDSNHAIVGRQPVRRSGYQSAPITIERDVWVGTGAVILEGVHIGEGAIIGANAVVTKDIPAWAVAAGVPAQVKYIREG